MIEVESSLESSRRRPIPKLSLPIPAIRVTSQFDSESCSFLHKISCKLFHGLAKLKLSFHNNPRNGQISHPQLGFINKYLSIIFHLQDCNALLTTSFDVGTRLQFRAVQDLKRGQTGQPKYFHIGYSTKHLSLSCTSDDDKSVVTRINLGSILLFKCHHKKAREGEVAIVASLTDPSYKLELASTVPSIGLQRASFRFPLGDVTVEKKEDEVRRNFLINGNLKGQVMDGVYTILHKDNDFNLSYSYKDEEMSFVPIISFPSNVLSFVFKRRFRPSGKLSIRDIQMNLS